MLIITGLMLLLTKIAKKKKSKISYLDSLIIGISQAIAIMPGISRSGTTICTSLYLGKEKNESAKFSFDSNSSNLWSNFKGYFFG